MGKDAFQCVDITAIARPVCKETFCITEPNQVPAIIRKAFKIAKEGKPGPVLIDLPIDVQKAEIDYEVKANESLPIEKPGPNREQIKEALRMLSFYQNPVLIMGGGVVLADAVDEFIQFAERLSLPVITTYMAKGAIPYDHPLAVGQVGIQEGTPFGTVKEVKEVARERIEKIGRFGGLVLGPTHSLQPDVPWENIVTLFKAINEYKL